MVPSEKSNSQILSLLVIFIKDLINKKILKKWTGNHIFLNDNKKEDKNHIKIIGKKGNNAISKHLLKNINCNFSSEVIKIANRKKVWEISFQMDQ